MKNFQDRLRALGGDFGDNPGAEQVTVAKTRTVFQTQVLKAGETDISHKDYLVSHGMARGATTYTPDLCTEYGVDRSGATIRLPTTSWPFDHAAVATTVFPSAAVVPSVQSYVFSNTELERILFSFLLSNLFVMFRKSFSEICKILVAKSQEI